MQLQVRSDAASWAPTDDGQVIVLDIRTSRYLSLNPSGSALWLKLADGATTAELSATLMARFGIDRQVADTDVAAFLAALRDRDLLAE